MFASFPPLIPFSFFGYPGFKDLGIKELKLISGNEQEENRAGGKIVVLT